jgi:hypothetical protein
VRVLRICAFGVRAGLGPIRQVTKMPENEFENDFVIPGFTAGQMRSVRTFFPAAFQRTATAIKSRLRFVHYTNADTAMKLIRNKEVWMRKASAMNDYMEIEHGRDCLVAAYAENKLRFEELMNGMFAGFSDRLEMHFNGWLPHFRADTYIACMSEHYESEDEYGRLSMWRAYGGVTGVAIVMNSAPFLRPSKALNAYSSRAVYQTPWIY